MKKIIVCVAMGMLSMLLGSVMSAGNKRDWAQFGRYAEANAALECTPDVVFIGNSITDFWPGKSPKFWAEHKGFVGRGISGQTTCEMLVRFRQDVINLHPRVVVILAGINDIAQNNGPISLANVLGNIQSMVELARAHGIKVALCSVVPCNRFAWRTDMQPAAQVKQLNGMIEQYVNGLEADDVIYVDYYTPMVNSEGGLDADLADDGCHPTPKGYAIMERVIADALGGWLK
ncbi:MAG: GDSL-type esterase/lipase family protein [Muribaculaceae bacterium]